VTARSESWWEPGLEGRRLGVAVALGVALFLLSFGLLSLGPFDEGEIADTPTYQRYGDAIVDSGAVPYRDFSLEYPPGALPTFLIPSLGPVEHYRTIFEILMLACGAAAVALVAVTLASVGASTSRLFGATAFAGLAPLALGPVVLTRFDLWPAMLTVASVAALVRGRSRLAFAILGLAVAAKLYPAVLLPVALAYVGRQRGGREVLAGLGMFAAVLAALLLPFAVLSPDGLAHALERQTGRPLQLESLGAGFLLALHQVGLYEPTVVSSFGSQNLVGGAPDALATLLTVLQILAVVGVWLLFASHRGWREELLAAWAAAVAVLVAFAKVLSPQFLIWLIPLVPLVGGRRGLAAAGLFAVALVLTQLWFPTRYWELVAFEPGPTWLLVARNTFLVALAAVLASAIGADARAPGRGRSRSG
jgi:hypothetical protein